MTTATWIIEHRPHARVRRRFFLTGAQHPIGSYVTAIAALDAARERGAAEENIEFVDCKDPRDPRDPRASYDVSAKEFEQIMLITLRVARTRALKVSTQTVETALIACHANGCPLRLDFLLTAPDDMLLDDVHKIVQFINPGTGRLTGGWCPRHAVGPATRARRR